jgi:3-oxoacyl-[acyl-carrier-protein] synthase-1
MRPVFFASDNIISPLGFSSAENYNNVRQGNSGISLVDDPSIASFPLYAGWIKSQVRQKVNNRFQQPQDYTWFEKIAIASAQAALNDVQIDPSSERVLFILSTTKGNIELVEQGHPSDQRIALTSAARTIAGYFKNENVPLVVSNACISGVTAILVAKRLLESGRYDHAVVVGADVLTNFVVSGFQSLLAISPGPCKPFDANRNGISLGEAAATVVLSTDSALCLLKK